jgi:hypothetical protein
VAVATWSTSRSIHPWQLAAGVALGVVIGGAIAYAAAQDANRAVSDTVETINQMIGREQQRAPLDEKERRRQASEQSAAKMLRNQQAQPLRADQQKASGGGGSEALDAAARKERACTKFYEKSPKGDGSPNNETMVECANEFIRAKRQFEVAYATGKP